MNLINKLPWLVLLTLIGVFGSNRTFASSTIALTTGQQVGMSAAVFRGTVLDKSCFVDPNDGLIYTRTLFRVDEAIKGTLPAVIKIVHRGGKVGARYEFYGLSPHLRAGGEFLMFVTRRADGQLTCTQGASSALGLEREKTGDDKEKGEFLPAARTLLEEVRTLAAQDPGAGEDVTDQAGAPQTKLVTGLLTDTNGIASRFTIPDRGEPISYLIDADNWPATLTLAQATNAVFQALNAWSAVTSLKFKFEGFASFGMGADLIPNQDQRLYIQLHDNYNRINTTNVLGVGGAAGISFTLPGAGWDMGGNVAGNEFHLNVNGSVVLERTNVALQNPLTLAEVLCHEIGHVLSMAHSSEVVTSNPLLTNSIMYFHAHSDGRGASLGAYDPPVVQQAYPSNNTPPFTYERVMDIATLQVGAPNLPGINEVELRGYDRQTANLTLAVTNVGAGPGTFSFAGNLVKFAPNAPYNATRLDPSDGSFYTQLYFRYSDGTNASPYANARVISLNPETVFSGAIDGIPDNWMVTYFGNANPNSGANHKATDDADGDRLINLQEYRSGMDPNVANSSQRITFISPNTIQWQAKPYELYELLGSTNLIHWTRVLNPVMPTTSTGTFTGITNSAPRQFFRVVKVP